MVNMKRALLGLVKFNVKLSAWFDKNLLLERYSRDGLKEFVSEVVPKHLKPGQRIVDIGGGKRPFVGTEVIRKKGMTVIGIDISNQELERAKKGSYDKKIVMDIGKKHKDIGFDADIVICEAVLEHVKDTKKAVENISKMLSKDGLAFIFIPCGKAPFARLNRLLPESLKRKILFTLLPEATHAQGFPAYYNNCSPKKMKELFVSNNTKITETRTYQHSHYFSVIFPIHVLWRISQVLKGYLGLDNCESFALVVSK